MQSAQNTAARVTVRLKSRSVEEQTEAIVQAARDHHRLHTDRAAAVYGLLVAATLAHHVALRPDVKATPSRLMAFMVLDELPTLLGLSRATVYRAFDDLEASGLVDKRAWYTDSAVRLRPKPVAKNPQEIDRVPAKPEKKKAPGRFTAAAGIVVDVVLTPAQGTRARVPAEALSHRRYRNLDADRQAGRTAWQWMTEVGKARQLIQSLEAQAGDLPQDKEHSLKIKALKQRAEEVKQSSLPAGKDAQINHLLRWTLSIPNQNPVTLTVSAQQEAVYRLADLQTATVQQRGAMIDERAQALCLATGDELRNLGFWRWLLWRMIELEYTQPGTIHALSAALLRLLVDHREWGGDARTLRPLNSPAALFIARLRKTGWWQELKAMKAA